jgi:hypothetical protein
MGDALLVRRFERLGHLVCELERGPHRHRPAREPLGQRLALDQLHDEEMPAGGLLHPVQYRDVRVIQCGEHLRFALEAREAVGIEGEQFGEDFDGDVCDSASCRAPGTPLPSPQRQ